MSKRSINFGLYDPPGDDSPKGSPLRIDPELFEALHYAIHAVGSSSTEALRQVITEVAGRDRMTT